MSMIYLPYGTTEGQTARTAEYIADVIRQHGDEAEPVDVKHARDPA
jgi:menaquinone-dependent protoporphyrinogen oxidase